MEALWTLDVVSFVTKCSLKIHALVAIIQNTYDFMAIVTFRVLGI